MGPRKDIQIDEEFQALISPLSDEERQQLQSNLIEEGCRDPLVTWNGVLLDGHNRLAICQEFGISYKTAEIALTDRTAAFVWIIKNQFGRRNLTDYQRAELALRLKAVLAEDAKARQRGGRGGALLSPNSDEATTVGRTDDAVAKAAGVGRDTIHKVAKIQADGAPELQDKARAGGVSIHAAAAIATIPDLDEQRRIAELSDKEIVQKAKEIRQRQADERRSERVEAAQALTAESLNGDTLGRFPVIYADPPWRYDFAPTDSRKIENAYPTMDLEDIKALPVDGVCHDDAVLFLWATSPKLPEAFAVMEAWGFTYRTCMVWVKDKIGMGYYARQKHELLLIGARGNLPVPEPGNRPPSVIEAPRGEHSKKPDETYGIIEAMYPEYTRLELFARRTREGWASWGNQVRSTTSTNA